MAAGAHGSTQGPAQGGRGTRGGEEQPGRTSPGSAAHGTTGTHGGGGGHGHSTAAWVGVGIILLGAAVMAFGVAVTTMWVFLVGVGVVVLGAVAGKVLSVMGFGQQVYDREVPAPNRGVR